ncbi:hypothetical protein OMO38_04565 [Chryseobacterium sp. 09-1422]|uniref:Uncharacterized protein n=1 Tax=Chryseobacterium kimseyorum TaxID=2984028 RepID=A0ABT3HVI0_9FLAO|nr:hypothetical protein [Chryseobacterium kimseyorum]MCW3167796.1 hypothetical protein [Chryseobacterium kimseyorum]
MSKTQTKEKITFDFSTFWRKIFLCAFAFIINFSFAQIYINEGAMIYDAEKSTALIADSSVCKLPHTAIENRIAEEKFNGDDHTFKPSKNAAKTVERTIAEKKTEIKKIQNTVKFNPHSKSEEFFLINDESYCAMISISLLKHNAVLSKTLNLKSDLKRTFKTLKNSDFKRIATSDYHPDYRSRPPPVFS